MTRRLWLGRGAAVGVGVGALSFVWLRAAYPEPDHWLASLIVGGLPPVLALVAAVLLSIAYFWRRPGPAAFVTGDDGRTFLAPPAGRAVWWPAALLMMLSVNLSTYLSFTLEPAGDPEPEGLLTTLDPVFLTILGLAGVAATGLQLTAIWAGWPRVELTPEGVRVQAPLGVIAVPWQALRPGFPWQPSLRADTLALTIDQPHLVRRRGLVGTKRAVPTLWLDIHPWVLADAIRYYVAHPEHRAAIGTATEHDRLRQTLHAGLPPPPAAIAGRPTPR
ncbi:hypothetical protein [Phytohabitans aurantiacus]|uniref:Uncharacterized protein n=1 Tax=Phytohabitans aurantiacus TaxID=3016789 RepID=A0ABQ5R8I4_9ACTN|nr:hypothetical protein [Phytohabitans aurantiacus]GLI02285.1 hypothetical protein Pa4123_75630 [Phytohabitans aurantiacus]